MELEEIVMKLNGSITPIGKSEVDEERHQTIDTLCGLVYTLIGNIITVSKEKDSHEHSVKVVGQTAHDFLYNQIPELLNI